MNNDFIKYLIHTLGNNYFNLFNFFNTTIINTNGL